MSFGINSRQLAEALQVQPVNMGVHASLGLKYMMDSVLPYVQPGDTVVLIPEYSQFFGSRAYGGAELLRMVLDVDRSGLRQLTPRQWLNILPELPKFTLSKLRPREYQAERSGDADVYGRDSFNQYGDAVAHWGLPPEKFAAYPPANETLNNAVFDDIRAFEAQVRARGGRLSITFPGLQDTSFDNLRDQIDLVEHQLRVAGFQVLGDPERYRIPGYLMFNTPYHLTQEGANLRTALLIEDLKPIGFAHVSEAPRP
ncbi:MAG: hypothetical protein HC822_15745 [Oscillochloris sp.]|nr:hypothetical protein [Oscillochloris sp.]